MVPVAGPPHRAMGPPAENPREIGLGMSRIRVGKQAWVVGDSAHKTARKTKDLAGEVVDTCRCLATLPRIGRSVDPRPIFASKAACARRWRKRR